jgi:F0F1-type ATP synthase epsilon subunit
MAHKEDSFKLTVLSEKIILYDGRCDVLFVPSVKKDVIVVLPYHTPMIMKLGEGKVVMKLGREKRDLATLKSGLLHVKNNEVQLLTNL